VSLRDHGREPVFSFGAGALQGCKAWRLLYLLFFCLLVPQGPAAAQVKEVRRVLIIYELGLSSPGVELVDQGVRTALRNSPYQIELYREYLETTLFPDAATQDEIRQWYIKKYTNRKLDLIIAAGPSPLRFLAASHDRYFGGVPLVFCGTSEYQADYPRIDSDLTGVWETYEPSKTLDAALRLEPNTKHVFVISGSTALDRHLEGVAKQDLAGYASKLDVTYLSNLTTPQMLEKVGHLPGHSIVLITDFAEDAAGRKFVGSAQASPMIVQAANAPVFSFADVDLGHGEVGGYVSSFKKEGQIVGDLALKILGGAKPGDLPVTNGVSLYTFDWSALRHWGLNDADLPAGSIIVDKQQSLWEAYRRYIVAAIFLLLAQALIIMGLLWQRAERRKAEASVRESEERFRLVANTAPVMIWMAGTDKLCNYVNQPFLAFTGRSLEEELGNGWTTGIFPVDAEVCREAFTRAFDRRAPFELEYRIRRYDGEYRWIFDLGVPRFNADGSFAGYIGSCIDVTERKLAEEALSTVSRKLIEAHEEERTWIARELHDDINQRLALLAVNLDILKGELPATAADSKLRLADVKQQAKDLGLDVQALSHRLHSSKLEYLGLTAAAAAFCREFSEHKGVPIEFHSENIPKSLPEEISLCLFRVLQEGLQNAAKHSGAPEYRVSIAADSGEVSLTVSDSGCGFDMEEALKAHGLGLTSMKERLKIVNGELRIDSQTNRGTVVHARVPFHVNTCVARGASA
jgi:PAS domain S-box-containing protein